MDLQRRWDELRVPPFEYYTNLLKTFGLLISGGIIGSAIFLGIYKNNLNLVIEQNRDLKKERSELLEKIETQNKIRNKQSVISEIEVVVLSDNKGNKQLDKITKNEIERKVELDLKVVIGQKIASFEENPEIYEKLISQRIYHDITQKDYKINVKSMVLTQTKLKVWVIAEEWDKTSMGLM
jgi:uncharacterized protein with ATP-grasp and redox domains